MLFDLDGVIYLGPVAVPGAAEGIAALHDRGIKIGFVTNNAARPPVESLTIWSSLVFRRLRRMSSRRPRPLHICWSTATVLAPESSPSGVRGSLLRSAKPAWWGCIQPMTTRWQ